MTDVALGSATWVMLRWGDRIEDDGAHNIAGRFHNIASAPMGSPHDAPMGVGGGGQIERPHPTAREAADNSQLSV